MASDEVENVSSDERFSDGPFLQPQPTFNDLEDIHFPVAPPPPEIRNDPRYLGAIQKPTGK